MHTTHQHSTPADQAHGLRRLFAGQQRRCMALVSNPHVAFSSVLLERLTTALSQIGLRTLVVDAADTSPAPHELAALHLSAGIEFLSPQISYLAARGLPLRHVDTAGSSAHWLQQVATTSPESQVLLVHTGAADVARLFTQQPIHPLLLAGEQPDSLTHAYAAMKLLTQRRGLMSFDLLLAAAPQGRLAARIAERLADCAERFLGATLRDWVAVDPASDVREAPCPLLLRLARAQAQCAEADAMPAWAARHAPSQPARTNPN